MPSSVKPIVGEIADVLESHFPGQAGCDFDYSRIRVMFTVRCPLTGQTYSLTAKRIDLLETDMSGEQIGHWMAYVFHGVFRKRRELADGN